MNGEKRYVTLPQKAFTILGEVLYELKNAPDIEVWLVGGAVRDLLLGAVDIVDCDLTVSKSFAAQAKEYARKRKGGFVMLDSEREIARIVRHFEGLSFTIDIAKYRASDIESDLRARDFTINAMAVPLKWPMLKPEAPIYDPLGGYDALQAKVLKMCSANAFTEDPLRIMRAFRFAATLGMQFDDELKAAVKRDCSLLKQVSGERIREELFKILAVAKSADFIAEMSKLGVLQYVLPELEATHKVDQNGWHHLDVFGHTIETLRNFEELVNRKETKIEGWNKFSTYLNAPISGDHTYKQLFKLACLLHDIGKPLCKREKPEDGKVVFYGHEMEGVRMSKEVAERLKLSCAELQFLMKVIKNHMRPGVMLQEGVSDRRLFKYYSETGRDGIGIALVSLADRMAARGPENSDELLEAFSKGIENIISDFYRQMEYKKQKPLIDGDDLLTHFRLQPGPKFREILDAVRTAQHLGQIRDRSEAVKFVEHLLETGIENSN